MAKNTWIIPTLIALGALSLALSLFISSRTEKTRPGLRPLAQAQLGLGQVSIFRKNLTSKEPLTRQANIYALDSVETGADGDATLAFDSGYRIHLSESTLITLDREKDNIVLILKRGEIQVANVGQKGQLFISQGGQRWEAADYGRSEVLTNTDLAAPPPPSTPPSTAPSPPTVPPSSGLTAQAIQDTLTLHRGNFFRCYTQLLQLTPGVSGQVTISFTIERSGRVLNPEVISSSLTDPSFKKCLMDTIKRVEFKSFQGSSIETLFPLKFE